MVAVSKRGMAALLALWQCSSVAAFHDCIQPKMRRGPAPAAAAPGGGETCQGGLCVGMHNGPHEGGPSSYPVGTSATGFTSVSSTMTVPEMPLKKDGITYYIWTDIFFGRSLALAALLRSISIGSKGRTSARFSEQERAS